MEHDDETINTSTLDITDLDVESLEQRLEMAVGGITPDSWGISVVTT